jgi:hypothetical protein
MELIEVDVLLVDGGIDPDRKGHQSEGDVG